MSTGCSAFNIFCASQSKLSRLERSEIFCLYLREARFLVVMGDRDFDSGESLCEGESLGGESRIIGIFLLK